MNFFFAQHGPYSQNMCKKWLKNGEDVKFFAAILKITWVGGFLLIWSCNNFL